MDNKNSVTVPYTGTINVSFEMVYSQEDNLEFESLYDLMNHANEKQIALIRKVNELKKQIKELENVAESWMNDYQKMKDKYEPEIVYCED